MKPLTKPMLAIVIVLGLSAAAAVAQPGPGPGGGPMMHGAPEQWRQRHDQRMQQLEQQLKLRDDQRPAWQAFLDAQKTWHESMRGHWQGMTADMTTPERFNRMAQNMRQGADGVQAVADAAGKLYQALDDAQKKTLDQFFAARPMGRRLQQ